MKTVAVIQARMGSTRLPGKVLNDMGGMPVLAWVVRAARAALGVDETWVATSVAPADDAIEAWCRSNAVPFFRGSESDVLDRFAGAAKASAADVVVRLTADCPLLDPAVLAQTIRLRSMTGADYASHHRFGPVGPAIEYFCDLHRTGDVVHQDDVGECPADVDPDSVTLCLHLLPNKPD